MATNNRVCKGTLPAIFGNIMMHKLHKWWLLAAILICVVARGQMFPTSGMEHPTKQQLNDIMASAGSIDRRTQSTLDDKAPMPSSSVNDGSKQQNGDVERVLAILSDRAKKDVISDRAKRDMLWNYVDLLLRAYQLEKTRARTDQSSKIVHLRNKCETVLTKQQKIDCIRGILVADVLQNNSAKRVSQAVRDPNRPIPKQRRQVTSHELERQLFQQRQKADLLHRETLLFLEFLNFSPV
ncbi:PREDICTED: uncharacterized protein LOC106805008 [Priapulus caudatus]|uniref:Uncharacterized protein LOC106805008 n=1 Tax=Priapulus caudatus TaxID=37621 RepID=A0ABM1DPT7_PRICU|nr:PREDICTED: uncharacterized protein LOC106805008 [Priapulus caudatus]